MPNTKPRKVIFDASSLRYLYTGLGQVCFHFLREWDAHPPGDDLRLYALAHPDQIGLVPKGIGVEEAGWLRRHAAPAVQKHLYRGCDLWHISTENTRLIGIPDGVPMLLTIQGLHFLDEATGEKAQKELEKVQRITDRATLITVASSYTENLVRKKLNLRGKEIKVIPYGVQVGAIAEQAPAWAPASPFLFTVATFFERKNLHVLLPMMKHLPDLKLVMAGDTNRDYGRKIHAMVAELGLGEQVILPGEITDKEKFWLYANGAMLLFPSISEGFGIPTVEAFNFGKPVCSSRYGSLEEVGGTHAAYWDNFEPAYMAQVVRQALTTDPSAVAARKEWAARFTWGQMVTDYANLYRQMLDGAFS